MLPHALIRRTRAASCILRKRVERPPLPPSFRHAMVVATAVAVAVAVRLAPWPQVYGEDGARLVGDSDPHYHVLRAERWLAGAPGAPWRDPQLNWPTGADVPWPPLFDALVAGTARAAYGPVVERQELAAASAALPVALGAILAVLAAALARALAGGGAVAAFLVAVLPAAAAPTLLGRVDQHGLEVVLFAALLLAFARAGERWRAAALGLAVLAPIAFWTWMGSALHLVLPLAAASAWHLAELPAAAPGLRALAAGAAGGAVGLAVSVAWWGAPGALASGATTGVGGLHVALLAATAAFAAGLLAARRARGARPAAVPRRAIELGVAALAPAAVLLAVPALRAGVLGGLTAAAAANPWYAAIDEFEPLVGSGVMPLSEELWALVSGYGLAHLAAAAGVAALARRWRGRPDERPRLLLLAVSLAVLVPAALARKRMGIYAAVPLAVAADAGIRWAAARLAGGARLRAVAAAALACAVVAPVVPEHLAPAPQLGRAEEAVLRAAADAPVAPGAEAVMAPWSLGHLVQFFADRPVVASPFGTEGGATALPDAAAFWFATDQATAEEVLSRRRAGLVLLADVVSEAGVLQAFAAPGAPRALEPGLAPDGRRVSRDTEDFWRLLPNRLYFDDGLATGGGPPLDAFRLLAETPATAPENAARETQWKLFERVPGARVEVAGAAGPVRAEVRLVTAAGRHLVWSVVAAPGPDGRARLRLPYATGANGLVTASPWIVDDGVRSVELTVPETEVRAGRVTAVTMTPPPPADRRPPAPPGSAAAPPRSPRARP